VSLAEWRQASRPVDSASRQAGTRAASARNVLLLLGLLTTWAPTSAAEDNARILLLDAAVVGSDVIAVGERGAILRSADDGRSWQPVLSPARATLTGVSFANPDAPRLGWAVGHDAQILATKDAGHTWAMQFQGDDLQDSFLDVIALDAQHVIAVGAYGLFTHTQNGGQTWTRRKLSDDDSHFNRITRGPAGTLYIAGERGTLLQSADAGNNWASMGRPYEGSFYGVLPVDRSLLLVHGLRGRIFRSLDAGGSWRPVATGETALIATAIKLRNNHLVLAGSGNALLVSHDGGQTMTALPLTGSAAVAEIIELPDGNLLALGEAGATVLPKP
jgi:photosystem II stability/assembly factor-like uncharacterized protein